MARIGVGVFIDVSLSGLLPIETFVFFSACLSLSCTFPFLPSCHADAEEWGGGGTKQSHNPRRRCSFAPFQYVVEEV